LDNNISEEFLGQHIWVRGYFAVSTGTVPDEVAKPWIESIKEMDDEDFKMGEGL